MGVGLPPSTGRVNMRGLLLLLPVLLVLFLAGTARTEEESPLVADADLPSNLLPAGEKVAVREARSAGKTGNERRRRRKVRRKNKNKKKTNQNVNGNKKKN